MPAIRIEDDRNKRLAVLRAEAERQSQEAALLDRKPNALRDAEAWQRAAAEAWNIQ